MVYVGSSCNGGLSEFNELIKFYNSNWNGSGFRYMDYGCYCGYDGKGYPIDETDNCCLFHDRCWAKAEADFGIIQNTMNQIINIYCIDYTLYSLLYNLYNITP